MNNDSKLLEKVLSKHKKSNANLYKEARKLYVCKKSRAFRRQGE